MKKNIKIINRNKYLKLKDDKKTLYLHTSKKIVKNELVGYFSGEVTDKVGKKNYSVPYMFFG